MKLFFLAALSSLVTLGAAKGLPQILTDDSFAAEVAVEAVNGIQPIYNLLGNCGPLCGSTICQKLDSILNSLIAHEYGTVMFTTTRRADEGTHNDIATFTPPAPDSDPLVDVINAVGHMRIIVRVDPDLITVETDSLLNTCTEIIGATFAGFDCGVEDVSAGVVLTLTKADTDPGSAAVMDDVEVTGIDPEFGSQLITSGVISVRFPVTPV
ncbi:unnamed protein product [Chrysoparadoxa australica]